MNDTSNRSSSDGSHVKMVEPVVVERREYELQRELAVCGATSRPPVVTNTTRANRRNETPIRAAMADGDHTATFAVKEFNSQSQQVGVYDAASACRLKDWGEPDQASSTELVTDHGPPRPVLHTNPLERCRAPTRL